MEGCKPLNFTVMRIIQLLLISVLFTACNVKPKPINYGADACHYCNMNIVDQQFASQIVTSKGKAYKYDAIECMVHSLQEQFPDVEMAYELIADFDEPGNFIDAKSASYLVSENLPSPMAENLSGYKSKDAAQIRQEELGGKVYSWAEIQTHLKRK